MSVHEIAVRAVKSGRMDAFVQRRAEFIAALTSQAGVVADREFESFMSMPEPRSTPTFIGMTTYESLAANAAIQRNLPVLWKFLRFNGVMDLLAYVYVEPIEGPDFDLATLAARDGEILEVAVRRVAETAKDEFDDRRRAFVASLAGEPGVVNSWEFRVVKGKTTNGLSVGMTVYRDRAAFDDISGRLMSSKSTQAYFNTFTPVALEYATSVTNT